MQTYLERYFGWPKVQGGGWLVCQRRSLRASAWESRQEHLWVAAAAFSWPLSASQAAKLLRSHWSFENTVFYVRDVSMDEDHLHGRKIAVGLSGIRNVVLNLLRRLIGASSIPEAHRKVAAMPNNGLHLLFVSLSELKKP